MNGSQPNLLRVLLQAVFLVPVERFVLGKGVGMLSDQEQTSVERSLPWLLEFRHPTMLTPQLPWFPRALLIRKIFEKRHSSAIGRMPMKK